MTLFFQVKTKKRGFTLIEVIITSTLIFLIFGGLIGAVQTLIHLLGQAKSEAMATSLASERMEYIRSFSYDEIGTISGVPSGQIPQTRSVVINGQNFDERVLITYVDNAADGLGMADSNAIMEDYKQIKVEYTWILRGVTHSMSLVSDIMPVGIESTAGGGTIRVNVFDASALPIAGATVRFVNSTVSPAIDTNRFTTATGEAYLSGATAGSNYEIYVSKSGYSTDGTYTADAAVVTPNTPPISVLAGQISTMNFQIDKVSNIVLASKDTPVTNVYDDDFADTSKLSTLSNTEVLGGSLLLQNTAGVFNNSGFAYSATFTPATIERWYSLETYTIEPTNTSLRTSVYDVTSGTPVIVPDSVLPGNSAGFGSGIVNLQSLVGTTYTSLMLMANLDTSDTATSSALTGWRLSYITTQNNIPNVDIAVFGQKSYGTDAMTQPVHKYNVATSTDGSGGKILSNLAWDSYTVTVTDPSYTVTSICPSSPVSLSPNVNLDVAVELTPSVPFAFRTIVQKPDGTPIPGAQVELKNGAYDIVKTSSVCGQAFFSTGLFSDTDYTVIASKSGYATQTIGSISISDDQASLVITLVP